MPCVGKISDTVKSARYLIELACSSCKFLQKGFCFFLLTSQCVISHQNLRYEVCREGCQLHFLFHSRTRADQGRGFIFNCVPDICKA